MAEDKTKKVPKENDYQFDDTACSAEFGNEGCKIPTEDTAEEK
ncbi:MAG: hypothetical protein VB085_01375 [Peptococcaceae bacterium]|nr:hypothetical protein [Peptococcaceae bacterium]